MYDAWGGKAALGWSRNKLRTLGLSEQLEEELSKEEEELIDKIKQNSK